MPAASPLFVLLFGSQEGYPERLKLKECLQQVLCFPNPLALKKDTMKDFVFKECLQPFLSYPLALKKDTLKR